MPIGLDDILPNVSSTLDGTGFIFGSGTSFEAGYPMMVTLTKQVIGALTSTERSLLDQVLSLAGFTYDAAKGEPNIEQIADHITAHHVSTSDAAVGAIEARLRDIIVEVFLGVSSPNLENHVKFFERLKRRAFGFPRCVWIFTTNYDSLFEEAASIAGVSLETGFIGTTTRFFQPIHLKCSSGVISAGRFAPNTTLTVKLVKLHGSLSWFEKDGRIFETNQLATPSGMRRVVVLPRRKKIIDTLVPPHDSLFSVSSQILGGDCKYLASCGFSFSDDHILEHLIVPPINAKKCRLFALSEEEPVNVANFNPLPNFAGGYNSHSHMNGARAIETTDLWKFSRFIELF